MLTAGPDSDRAVDDFLKEMAGRTNPTLQEKGGVVGQLSFRFPATPAIQTAPLQKLTKPIKRPIIKSCYMKFSLTLVLAYPI